MRVTVMRSSSSGGTGKPDQAVNGQEPGAREKHGPEKASPEKAGKEEPKAPAHH